MVVPEYKWFTISMAKRTYQAAAVIVLALIAGGVIPLMAANLEVESTPLSDKTYERVDVESVSQEIKLPVSEWLTWVQSNNHTLVADITSEDLCTIDVQISDPGDSRD